MGNLKVSVKHTIIIIDLMCSRLLRGIKARVAHNLKMLMFHISVIP